MKTHQLLLQQLQWRKTPATSISFGQQFRQGCLSLVQGVGTALSQRCSLSKASQFWEFLGRNGQTYWKVYDPAHDRLFQLDSLQAVLEWVEERHRLTNQSQGVSFSCFNS